MGRIPDATYRLTKTLLSRKSWPKILDALHDVRPKIPQSQAYRITQWLTFHGALAPAGPGYTVDVRRTLDLLAGVRRANLVPTRTLTTAPNPQAVSLALQKAAIRHAWGFATAANLHTFFEPLARLQVYVQADPRRKTPPLSATLPRGDTPLEVYQDRVDELHATTIGGLPVTELLETAIDVRAHPGGGAYADLLQQAIEGATR